MQGARLTMELESEAAARMWAAFAECRGAAATHLSGAKLELTFPTSQAKHEFALALDVAIQTLARRPGHA
jgi:hypothetical protein